MVTSQISNPARILQVLDSHLEKETRVVLFGRAALALGFGEIGASFGKTQDVDAILPSIEMAKIEADTQFWHAIDLTNKELSNSGLYISHLFTDQQVALTKGWLDQIVAIDSSAYRYLRLFRPRTVDLILTKMMRNDREDIEDIGFLLRHGNVKLADLESAFADVSPLPVPELSEIFLGMQPLVKALAGAFTPKEHIEKQERSILEGLSDLNRTAREKYRDREIDR